MNRRRSVLLSAALILSSLSTVALRAQSGAGLIAAPWRSPERIELSADMLYQTGSSTSGAGSGDLDIYIADGRARAGWALSTDESSDAPPDGPSSTDGLASDAVSDAERAADLTLRFDEPGPGAEGAPRRPRRPPLIRGPDIRVGVEATQVFLDTADPLVPDRLDAYAVGLGVADLDFVGGWTLSAGASVGYAGATPFTDGDALVFTGTLLGTYRLDERFTMLLAVSHDTNRVIFPDIPLPSIAWILTPVPELRIQAGFPFTSLRWMPSEQWILEFRLIAINARGAVTWRPARSVDLFLAVDTRTDAFWLEDAPARRRVLLRSQSAELGARWRLARQVSLEVAGGWAFGQELTVGWDVRDAETLREIDASPFVRAGIALTF